MKYMLSLLLLLFSTSLYANEDVFELQMNLQKQSEEIVRQFDEHAKVIVKIEEQKVERKLPGLPLILSDMKIRGPGNRIVLKEAKVTIYSHAPEMPFLIQELVGNLFKPYGVEAQIEVQLPPKKFNFNVTEALYELTRPTMLVVYVAYILVALAMGLALISKSTQDKRLRNLVKEGLGELKSIFEGGSSVKASAFDESVSSVTNQNMAASNDADTDSNLVKELTEEALIAIFCDCYWSKEDSYAKYLWLKLPLEMRKKVMNAKPMLKEYAGYLSDVEPQAKSYHQEMYYLQPLPIQHLSNEDLSEIVRGKQSLYAHLPSMRSAHISMDVEEKIKCLQESASSLDVKDYDFLENKKESATRGLRRRMNIQINNLEEEQQVLQIPDPSIEVMEDIVVLGWAEKLDEDSLSEILKKFNAADLASAWDAPLSVLEKFKSCLPEKKLNLVMSYVEKSKPSRKSQVYSMLHKEIIQALRSNEREQENVDVA
tara:strand:+ start:1077 stop:2531 length:1455 start_codon:yes stop_codon:yes gene_type:complete